MRLFIAIDLSDAVKNQLEALRADIPGANWGRRSAYHLTLRFLGDDIAEDRLPVIRKQLELVKADPFELSLRGVGCFPSGGRKPARVLWVGVKSPPALQVLYGQVERAVLAAGFEEEDRPFTPHITLARLRLPRVEREVSRFLQRYEQFQSEAFPVSEFVLYSSVLTPQGAEYTPLLKVPLRG